jgi:hypothetical protein
VSLEFPNLENKVIGLVLAYAPISQVGMVTLERARFEVISDRVFVTGYIPQDDPDSWVKGLPSAVAWEFVGYYVLFNSLEEYLRRAAVARPPWWRRILGRANA